MFSPEQVAKIVELYKAEMPTRQIAEIFHSAPTSIRDYLRREGIPMKHGGSRPLQRQSHKRLEAVRYMYEYENRPIKEIAEHFGLARSTIQRWVKLGGMQRRPRSRGQAA